MGYLFTALAFCTQKNGKADRSSLLSNKDNSERKKLIGSGDAGRFVQHRPPRTKNKTNLYQFLDGKMPTRAMMKFIPR
jgi:hypothetical protein